METVAKLILPGLKWKSSFNDVLRVTQLQDLQMKSHTHEDDYILPSLFLSFPQEKLSPASFCSFVTLGQIILPRILSLGVWVHQRKGEAGETAVHH